MKYEEFKKILKENHLTVKKFSELAGISYATCNNWAKSERKVSSWVESWLRIYEENQKLKELKKDDCEEYKKALAKALLSSIGEEK